jgi:TonB-dependent receptor
MRFQTWIIRIAFAVLLVVSGMQGVVLAQKSSPGEIAGVIKDQTSKEVLPYATVKIKGTVVGVVTDLDGNFRLLNLQPGNYALQVTYTGYNMQEVKVTVASGGKSKITVELNQPLIAIGEVVVTSQRMGQNAAINQQLNSTALVNVVSKDRIRELPDVTAAEAIGRLPGVTLERSGGEGSKVILRGLDPKFSNVTINGVKQPATDAINRSVDLSGISPELLSGVEVFKSPTADMDGDAFGGTVNLVITKAPDQPKNQIRLYGGYAALKQQFGNFKGSWDFSQRFLDKKLGIMAQANYENTDRSSEGLRVSYHQPDQSSLESLKNLFVNTSTIIDKQSLRKRIGANTFIDYQFGMGSVYISGMYNSAPRQGYTQTKQISKEGQVILSPTVNESTTNSLNTTIGGVLNLKLAKVDWSYNHVQTKVNGNYNMELDLKTDGPYGLVSGFENKKDITDYNYLLDNLASTSSNPGTGNKTYLEKAFWAPDTTKQINNSVKIDIEIPIKVGNSISGFFKIGGKYASEKRDRQSRTIDNPFYYLMRSYNKNNIIANNPKPLEFLPSGQISASNFTSAEASSIFDERYEFFPNIAESKVRDWAAYHTKPGDMDYDASFEHNNYETNEETKAAYIMMKLDFKDFITFVPGLRLENSDNTYYGVFSTIGGDQGVSGSFRPDTSFQNYTELLPSFHLKIKTTKWLDLRLSAVKTLSRPDYLWVLPRFKFTAEQNSVGRSNPDLKHATAWNFDASMTAYTGKFGMMSIGGYYKEIENMFYAQNDGTMSMEEAISLGLPPRPIDIVEDYINLPKAWVKGLEFEYTTHFNFLSSPANRFALGFNITRLWSETTYKKWQKVDGLTLYKDIRPVMSVDFTRSKYKEVLSPMPSQADYTGNLWLGYDYRKLSCRISAAYQGYRLTGINVSSESVADQYHTNFRLSFDASAKYEILKSLHILLNLNNFTNAPDQSYRYNSNFLTSKDMYGFTCNVGVQYNF